MSNIEKLKYSEVKVGCLNVIIEDNEVCSS